MARYASSVFRLPSSVFRLVTYAIAAAGTGGHVFPGLAVGEALVDAGVSREEILFVGGARLESKVYPDAGFPFLQVDIRGMQRRLTSTNLRIPALVFAAGRQIASRFRSRGVAVLLAMGGYVSVPAGLAARRVRIPLMLHEQNAEAGLANRFLARWARRTFGSFPTTIRLPGAEWVGNPIRRSLASFDRESLRPAALARYGLDRERPVVGIFGGSLGAGILNRAAAALAPTSATAGFSILHLAGSEHFPAVAAAAGGFPAWHTVGFEDRMDLFYGASDLVISRAGGAVAELTATSTPSILVPGGFGSGDHQSANAAVLASAGAAMVVREADIGSVPATVSALIARPDRLRSMALACSKLARPDAADVIAAALARIHG